jgi:teichuronic acid exporter
MSIKKKTIQSIFWAAIQNWGSQAGSLIVFLILARLLPPEDFGLVALANVFITFTQIFLEQGFAAVLIQRQNIETEHINTAFWTQIIIAFLLTAVSLLSANWIAESFNQPQLSPIMKWLSILFIISALTHVQRALIKRKFAFKILAICSLLGVIVSGFVGIAMAFFGYGVWSLVGQQLSYESVELIVLWSASNWRPQWQLSWKHLSDLSNFTLNLLGEKLVFFFNQKTDHLLIGYFLGEIALGYYAIAHRILQVMTQLLIETIIQVALPTFSRLQNDSQGFLDAFYRATQFTSLIAFPVFFAVVTLAPEIVITLFGKQWIEAIPIMQILSFAGMIRIISLFQRSTFLAMGKPSLQLKLGLLNATLNLIVCSIAIKWGILAVATAYVISDYLVFPFGQWLLSKLILIDWKTYLSQFIAPISCTLVMVLSLFLSQQLLTAYLNPALRLIICSIMGTTVYSLTLIRLFPKLFKQIWDLVILLKPDAKS